MLKYVDGEAVEMTEEEVAEFEASRATTYSKSDYATAIENHLNAVASERGYSSALSAVSYMDDPNPAYAAEGLAFKAWRSAVWTYAYAELTRVQSGERAQPTPSELVGELPSIEW